MVLFDFGLVWWRGVVCVVLLGFVFCGVFVVFFWCWFVGVCLFLVGFFWLRVTGLGGVVLLVGCFLGLVGDFFFFLLCFVVWFVSAMVFGFFLVLFC